jgi:hypothetical protein
VTPAGDGEIEGDADGDGEGVALEDGAMGVDVEPAVGDGPQAEITASKEATPPTWNMTRLVRPVITEPLGIARSRTSTIEREMVQSVTTVGE